MDGALAVGDLGQLGHDRAGSGAERLDLRRDRVEAVGKVIDEIDGLGAFLGEAKRRRAADATPSPGDEDNLAGVAFLVQRPLRW